MYVFLGFGEKKCCENIICKVFMEFLRFLIIRN